MTLYMCSHRHFGSLSLYLSYKLPLPNNNVLQYYVNHRYLQGLHRVRAVTSELFLQLL